jgi:predicted kinase
MIRTVICDIDGTVANLNHRLHHITNGKKDWDAFFVTMNEDLPIQPVIDLLGAIDLDSYGLVMCSGRPEAYRNVTTKWLVDHGLDFFDALYMRPDGDHRADTVVKLDLLRAMREDGFDPFIVIDDRPSVVRMWRDQGLVCLQAADWEERSPVAPGLLTLMVGPSGAGKTTWIMSDDIIEHSHVVSSDEIRLDLLGDSKDQSRNDNVFRAVHAVASARVRNGLPAVIDATNIRRRDRLACVACAPIGAPVRYVVVDRPLEEKLCDRGWRSEELIQRYHQTFQAQLKDILAGDKLPNVTVVDARR